MPFVLVLFTLPVCPWKHPCTRLLACPFADMNRVKRLLRSWLEAGEETKGAGRAGTEQQEPAKEQRQVF